MSPSGLSLIGSGLGLIGLALDITGFLILGTEFWKRGGDRLKWSPDNPFWDRLGMSLVVAGFFGQAAAPGIAVARAIWPSIIGGP